MLLKYSSVIVILLLQVFFLNLLRLFRQVKLVIYGRGASHVYKEKTVSYR